MNDKQSEQGSESARKSGWRAREMDQPDVAHDLFRQSLDLAQRSNDRQAIARATLALANNVLHYSPSDEADPFACRERLCEDALNQFRSIGDKEGVADALVLAASIAPGEKGSAYLDESLGIARQRRYTKGVVACLRAIGNRVAINGDRSAAAARYREALALARRTGDKQSVADTLNGLAIVSDGCNTERRKAFEEAHGLYRELDQKASLARSLMECCAIACEDGEYEYKERYAEEALLVCRDLGSQCLESTCLALLAQVARDRGDLDRANKLEQLSQDNSDPIEEPAGLEEALTLGDADTALSFIRKWFTRK